MRLARMNQISRKQAGKTVSWRWLSIICVMLLCFVSEAEGRRGVVREEREAVTRQLPLFTEKESLKETREQRISSKKKKKCKGSKGSKSKKSKAYCDEVLQLGAGATDYEYAQPHYSPHYSPHHSPSTNGFAEEHPAPSPHGFLTTEDSPAQSPVYSPSAPYYWSTPSMDWPVAEVDNEPTTWNTSAEPQPMPESELANPEPTDVAAANPEPTDPPRPDPKPLPSAPLTSTPTSEPTSATIQSSTTPFVTPAPAQMNPTPWPSPDNAPMDTLAGEPVPTPDAANRTTTTTVFPTNPTFAPFEAASESGFVSEPFESGNEEGTLSTCQTKPEDASSNSNFEVLEFDYQLYVDSGSNDIKKIVREVEDDLHELLSQRLLECHFTTEMQQGYQDGETDDFKFMTVISLPEDYLLESTTCSDDITMEGTDCHVITAGFGIEFLTVQQQSFYDLLDGMSTIMKELMPGPPDSRRKLEGYELLLANDKIRALYFKYFNVDEAAAGTLGQGTVPQARPSTNSSKRVVGALSLAGVAAIVILGGLFIFRRRRTNRSYLDMSNDYNSRIGIQERTNTSHSDPSASLGADVDDESGYSLSVYTSGLDATEDVTPQHVRKTGRTNTPTGISPKEPPGLKPIVSPALCQTQDLARSLSQSSISIASEDINPFPEPADV